MWCPFKNCDRNDIYVTRFVYNLGKRPLTFSHVTKMSPPGWGLPSSSQAWLRASSEDDHWCWESKHSLCCRLPASAIPTYHLPPAFSSKHSSDTQIPACQYIWSTSPFGEEDLGTCYYHTWSPLSWETELLGTYGNTGLYLLLSCGLSTMLQALSWTLLMDCFSYSLIQY